MYEQLPAVECNIGQTLLALDSNTVHVPGNEDWKHA